MPICPICLTDLSDNEKFCPLCGNAVTEDGFAQTETAPELTGIGGWLIVMMIGLMGSILLEAVSLYIDLAAGTYLEFGLDLCFLSFAIICLVFMFRHSRHFPKLGIALYVFGLLNNLFFYVTHDSPPNTIGSIVGSLIGTAIWVTYLLRSKRVKNTFVR